MSDKKVVLKISEDDFNWLKEFMTEYRDQDNRCTAYPIAVRVQTKVRDITEEGYGDIETYYSHDACYETDFEGMKEYLKEYAWEEMENDDLLEMINNLDPDFHENFIKMHAEMNPIEDMDEDEITNRANEFLLEIMYEKCPCIIKEINKIINDWAEEDSWDFEHYMEREFGFQKYYMKERWEDKGEFFTIKAAQEHIQRNSYHYKEPRDYVVHAWRNPETLRLFEILGRISGIEDWRKG